MSYTKQTFPEPEEQKILEAEESDFEFCSYQMQIKGDPFYAMWMADVEQDAAREMGVLPGIGNK